jgi:hypothetical protein
MPKGLMVEYMQLRNQGKTKIKNISLTNLYQSYDKPVIKYQPTNQKDDDSIINEIGVFTFAIVKTESKLNCNG